MQASECLATLNQLFYAAFWDLHLSHCLSGRAEGEKYSQSTESRENSHLMRKFTAFACGTGAGLAAFYLQKLRDPQQVVHNSWTNNWRVGECALWDSNWDFRDPKSLVKPQKNDQPQEENRYNSDLEKNTVKAARHIILIRHGEYLDKGENDETHHLTERGRLQAQYTGKRLHEMGIKWDKVIASTMVRAQETTDIILKEIDYNKDDVKHCSYLREGAPIPPQPPVGHWKPAASVSAQAICPLFLYPTMTNIFF